MKKKRIDNIDEEILRALDGLPVSDDFIEKRNSSRELFNMMIAIESDRKAMSKEEHYSKLTNNISNEKNTIYIEKINADSVVDFYYRVASVFDFSLLELPVARCRYDENEERTIYLNKGIEVCVLRKTIYLKIRDVKKRFEIKLNDKMIVKVSSRKYFDMELSEGSYQISVDDYNADIIIK